ncbi:hypothetical protein JNJ66_00330 [Candidatus Saccharibacteria bacterium]|nr:hypothetical protein [Candidatus Saccharibacteria bacterium]
MIRKRTIVLASFALVICLVIAAILVNRTGTKDMERPIDNSSADTKNPSDNKANNKNVEEVDKLQSVVPEPLPASWTEVAPESMAIKIAYPSEWSFNGGQPRPSTDGKAETQTLYVSYLGSDSQLIDRPCRLTVQTQSFAEVIKITESQDTDDDGVITDTPYKLWTDVVEKDYFTYDDRQAVRYLFANRVSTSDDKKYKIFYLVEGNSKTYSLVCSVRDGLNEKEIDSLFKQIHLQ